MASNLLMTNHLKTHLLVHFLSSPSESLPSTGPRRSTGGGRKTPPFRNATEGGIRAVVRSPVTATRHAQARLPPLGPRPGLDHRRCRSPPPPAYVEPRPPRRVPSGLDLRPPHPRPPPSLSGNRHRRTTSCGPPSLCRHCPALLLPGSRSRSVKTSARSFPCRRYRRRGLGGGERPRRRRQRRKRQRRR